MARKRKPARIVVHNPADRPRSIDTDGRSIGGRATVEVDRTDVVDDHLAARRLVAVRQPGPAAPDLELDDAVGQLDDTPPDLDGADTDAP